MKAGHIMPSVVSLNAKSYEEIKVLLFRYYFHSRSKVFYDTTTAYNIRPNMDESQCTMAQFFLETSVLKLERLLYPDEDIPDR